MAAEVVGKPAQPFFHAAVADMGLEPQRVAMIGDDVEADVRGAREAGLRGALVPTGKYRPGDEKAGAGRPDAVVADLAEAVAALDDDP